ncbi:MAG TPA: ribosome maturation factor RimM [Candidatus Eisenbacteria bacterium]
MLTERDEEPVLVGTVVRPHGLTGEVVVQSWSDAPERFRAGGAVTARLPGGARRAVTIASSRPFRKRLLVRFEGVGTLEEAEALRGAELWVPRRSVAPLPRGRYYRFELVGLRVRTRSGEDLGTVAEVFATGSNDVIVVHGPKGEMLLPAIESVLLEVSPERGELRVAVPAGLLDRE